MSSWAWACHAHRWPDTGPKENEAIVIVGMLWVNSGSTTHLAGWHVPR